mmetsp:Transcript_10553/g.30051  ORF Transcript_10553/g.30051 Transcript_10553/m.30051 type:complete len:628 (-) Transcript_10553:41-1924(-)
MQPNPDSGDGGLPELRLTIQCLPTSILNKVFACLDPRDLVVTSATCHAWAALLCDASSNQHWRRLYLRRWALPAVCPSLGAASAGRGRAAVTSSSWQFAYSTKMASLASWDGPWKMDLLNGHREAVRAVQLCPSLNLLATGSADRTVKLWDLSAGMCVATSLQHGGTVRSVAMDSRLLVSGSSDATIRCWRAWPGEQPGGRPFVVTAEQPMKLLGKGAHTGPVTGLELTEEHLYSCSWDMTARCWRRAEDGRLRSVSVWGYQDFAWDVAVRGPRLLVAAGRDLFVQDLATGQLLTVINNVFGGHAAALEGAYTGQLLFTGGSNGQLLMHDLRAPPSKQGCALLWQGACNSTITSLALEDPWLVLASTDGIAGLLDLAGATRMAPRPAARKKQHSARPLLSLKLLGGGQHSGYAVDIQDRWVACGSDCETARTWHCGLTPGRRLWSTPAPGRRKGFNKQSATQRAAKQKGPVGRASSAIQPAHGCGGSLEPGSPGFQGERPGPKDVDPVRGGTPRQPWKACSGNGKVAQSDERPGLEIQPKPRPGRLLPTSSMGKGSSRGPAAAAPRPPRLVVAAPPPLSEGTPKLPESRMASWAIMRPHRPSAAGATALPPPLTAAGEGGVAMNKPV